MGDVACARSTGRATGRCAKAAPVGVLLFQVCGARDFLCCITARSNTYELLTSHIILSRERQ